MFGETLHLIITELKFEFSSEGLFISINLKCLYLTRTLDTGKMRVRAATQADPGGSC